MTTAEGILESFENSARITPLMQLTNGQVPMMNINGDMYANEFTSNYGANQLVRGIGTTALTDAGWNKVHTESLTVGVNNTVLQTSPSVAWGKIGASSFTKGANNTIVSNNSWTQVTPDMIVAGAASTVLNSTGWGAIPTAAIIPGANAQRLITKAGVAAWSSYIGYVSSYARVGFSAFGGFIAIPGSTVTQSSPNYTPATGVYIVPFTGLYKVNFSSYHINNAGGAESVKVRTYTFTKTSTPQNGPFDPIYSYNSVFAGGGVSQVTNIYKILELTAGESYHFRYSSFASTKQDLFAFMSVSLLTKI